MFSFDFWVVVLVVLSLGGHTDTYRTVSSGPGAFELCLPSYRILLPNKNALTPEYTSYAQDGVAVG